MSQASSRKLATDGASRIYAKRRRKLRRTISNRTITDAMAFLSKRYSLLPCFCEHDPIRMIKRRQALVLSKSANAFWHRNSKSKAKLISEKQQRNNSTAFETQPMNSSRSNKFQTFRKSIVQRFNRKVPVITARSVTHKHPNTYAIKHKNSTDHPPVNSLNTIQTSLNRPSLTPYDSQQSSHDSDHLVLQDNLYDNKEDDENDTLKPPISSFKTEQQNINATDNTSRTIRTTSQTIMNDFDASKKTKRTAATSNKKHPKKTRNTSLRATTSSLTRKKPSKQKLTSKRKTSVSNKKMISTSKRKKPTSSLSFARSKPNSKRMTYGRTPFPDPNLFHSIPRMQNSNEITVDNVHENHLCCKPITSVKGLSTNDQKKLIEHDYLTLISLLPMYLGSQGNFQYKIREKTNISHDGAFELDRLMNEWSSARLFIGANSYNKTLTQTI